VLRWSAWGGLALDSVHPDLEEVFWEIPLLRVEQQCQAGLLEQVQHVGIGACEAAILLQNEPRKAGVSPFLKQSDTLCHVGHAE
jgi:hypothetical protein